MARKVAIRALLPGCPLRPWLSTRGAQWTSPRGKATRYGNETRASNGRVRVHLGVHPYANSAGWQWRYRLLVACEHGRLPRNDEHVNHANGIVDDDRIGNRELISAAYHGQRHASAVDMVIGADGRFVYRWPEREVNRLGPVISPRRIDDDWAPESRVL